LIGDVAAAPAYANNTLYIVTVLGNVYAYNPDRRAVRWSAALGAAEEPRTTPIVAGDTLLVPTANGHLFALAAAGDGQGRSKLLWRYTAIPDPGFEASHPGTIPSLAAQPAVSTSGIYVLSNNGTLSALKPDAPDRSGPIVDKKYPDGGPYSTTPTPTISARVRDPGSGVLPGSIALVVDRVSIPRGAFTYDDNTGKLSYAPGQALLDGTHTVQVSARDNRGNSSDSLWTFTLSHDVPSPYTRPGARPFPGPGGFPGGGFPGGGFPGGGRGRIGG
jgi:hypothetical protein